MEGPGYEQRGPARVEAAGVLGIWDANGDRAREIVGLMLRRIQMVRPLRRLRYMTAHGTYSGSATR
jgi:hypothetical protein